MFEKCKSLKTLPEKSRWKMNNAVCLDKLFNRCSSLISIPDLSNME